MRGIFQTIFFLGLWAAPIGFAISSCVALSQTTGMRRRLSALTLAFGALGVLFAIVAFNPSAFGLDLMKGYYFLNLAGVALVCLTFTTYLAHTHWPVQSKAVNLPATSGMTITFLSIMCMYGLNW